MVQNLLGGVSLDLLALDQSITEVSFFAAPKTDICECVRV